MDEAGEAPENMEALKTAVMEKLSEWYMRNHGVGTMANVEDMCTLLQVHRSTSPPVFFFCWVRCFVASMYFSIPCIHMRMCVFFVSLFFTSLFLSVRPFCWMASARVGARSCGGEVG